MVNCNPETVSTDYDTSDRLYFEPLTKEDVLNVIAAERPEKVIVSLGGQTPLKLSGEIPEELVAGTSAHSIDEAEDRERWNQLCDELKILPARCKATVARVWDLNFAQAARTIAIPANERVVGLSANADVLVTVTQNTVNLWRTSDGRRNASFELGASVSDTILSDDGQHLLVTYQSDPDTIFEVWELESGDVVADLSVAGVPAVHAIDAAATFLAVADYDRALRVWDLRRGEQVAQFDLAYQPTEVILSANGEAVGVVLGEQGVEMWLTGQPELPLFRDSGPGEWQFAFSPSGARFIAGNRHEGIQAYRTSDATPTGPVLDTGLSPGGGKIVAFNSDEQLVITAGVNDIARFWSVPVVAAEPGQEAGASKQRAPAGANPAPSSLPLRQRENRSHSATAWVTCT